MSVIVTLTCVTCQSGWESEQGSEAEICPTCGGALEIRGRYLSVAVH